MEQHPVPQNITSFQFRLIGDMTIKQFGYLAGGIALAFIFYKLPLPFFFTWPLTITAALAGFGFAFVPIEERPMDIWVFSFLRNVYNPTMYHWEHTDPIPEPTKTLVPPPPKIPALSIPQFPLPFSKPHTTPVLNNTLQTPKPPKEVIQPARPASTAEKPVTFTHKPSFLDTFFAGIDNLFVSKPHAQPAYVVQSQAKPRDISVARNIPAASQPEPFQPAPSTTQSVVGSRPQPTPVTPPTVITQQPKSEEEQKKEEDLIAIKRQLENAQKQLETKTTEDSRIQELQAQLTAFMTERQQMENELMLLRAKSQASSSQPPQPMRPAGVVNPIKPNEPTVKTMNPDVATRAGLPRLTTFPNVVTGIVKDFENNLLPGVLVTVKDKEGVPLRALKTNKLGQFAASTQLLNGTYVVEVEDPRERFVFDRAQITINGTVLPALQIVAKSKRTIDREKLEKEIFGSPNASA